MMKTKLVSVVALAGITSSVSFTGSVRQPAGAVRIASLNSKSSDGCEDDLVLTRRKTLESWLVGAAAIGFLASPENAMAFDNRISTQYDDRPKQRGAKVSCSTSTLSDRQHVEVHALCIHLN